MPRHLPEINRHILKLARQIEPSCLPEYVDIVPARDCQPGESHDNVSRIVRTEGGAVQYGWALRELPDVFVEGHFHAVWRRTDGKLLDVTPAEDGAVRILFLPDSKRVWDGEPIDPRRMMLHERPCYCGSGLPFNICHGMDDD